MKVLGIIGKIYNVRDVRGGTTFSMSLGKDKGFIRVVWMQETKFTYLPKEKDTILVPVADLSIKPYTNNQGVETQQVSLMTNYIQYYNPIFTNNKKDDSGNTRPVSGVRESMDETLSNWTKAPAADNNWEEKLKSIKEGGVDVKELEADLQDEEVDDSKKIKLAQEVDRIYQAEQFMKRQEKEQKDRLEALKSLKEGE